MFYHEKYQAFLITVFSTLLEQQNEREIFWFPFLFVVPILFTSNFTTQQILNFLFNEPLQNLS